MNSSKLEKILIITSIFILPLIGPYHGFSYEQSKAFLFIVLTSLSGFVWMGRNFKWTLINKLSVVFILTLLITSLTGIDSKMSLLGAPPYFQGWGLYLYLWLFSLMVWQTRLKLEKWAYVLVGAASLVAIVAIKDWSLLNIFHQTVPIYAGRIVSTFGQPNFYSGFILFSLPFWHLLIKKSFNLWLILIGFIMVGGIILSESRIAIILTLILLLWYLVAGVLKLKWLLVIIICLAILIGIVAGLFSQQLFRSEWDFPLNQQWLIDNSPEKRVYIYPVIWDLIKERPLLGYGLENISVNFTQYFSKMDFNSVTNPVYYSLRDLVVDRSHNYILDLLMFGGVVSLLSWLVLVGVLFKRTSRGFFLIPLLIYLIWIQFQNQSVVHLIYFWLLVGLIDQNS